VLGGGRREGSDRRARRHLADAVPAVHSKPRLPARAGFEESDGGRDIHDANGAGKRPLDIREINRADQAFAALIRPETIEPDQRASAAASCLSHAPKALTLAASRSRLEQTNASQRPEGKVRSKGMTRRPVRRSS